MFAKLAFLHQTSIFRSHWKRLKELKPAWGWETKLEVCLPGICSGWGNEHYVTFDGTYYHFKENCTYVLVELIQPSSQKFWIHIDNYYCGATDGAICSMSLLIFHSNSLVILTQAKEHGKETNLVKYFVQMSSHYFAVVTLLYCQMPCHVKGWSLRKIELWEMQLHCFLVLSFFSVSAKLSIFQKLEIVTQFMVFFS